MLKLNLLQVNVKNDNEEIMNFEGNIAGVPDEIISNCVITMCKEGNTITISATNVPKNFIPTHIINGNENQFTSFTIFLLQNSGKFEFKKYFYII